MKSFALLPLLILAFGCGPEPDPQQPAPDAPSRARVVISYLASTTPRTDLPPSTAPCVAEVGPTHIHPSWRDFKIVKMGAVTPERWQLTFTDVPIGALQRIRISDGNVCDENSTGAATRNVYANDVLLTRIVSTPGDGTTEPGLSFTTDLDGNVTP